MLNVARVIKSARLSQAFTVTRTTGRFGEGGWIPSTPEEITMTGIISPASPKDLQQVPEGDRLTEAIKIYSSEQIYTTHQETATAISGISDKITWGGILYRVYQVFPYRDYGYYKAIAGRMQGS